MATVNRYGRPNPAHPPRRGRTSGIQRSSGHRPGTRRNPGRTPGTVVHQPTPKPPITKWLWVSVPLVVVALVVILAWRPDPGPQAGCVIAVDAQGSASPMTQTYREWLPGRAESCAAADRAKLNIALISGETSTGTVTPATTDLRRLKLTGNAERDDMLVREEIDRVVEEANDKILAAPEQQGGTDIVGALCVASDLLKGHEPKRLVLLTDGINNREPFVLTRAPLDDASIGQHVIDLRASGQLCDLAGTRVEIYGAGIGWDTGEMSAEQLAGVRRFWSAVVSASGGELVAYQRNP
ncbi:hypothetical protein [Granulicoccus sp. GXG6511]|uniref:hypothetical protein n=1 Tax=Granulicoccus sp. GXG6511 TaxID=3381351 RepID=UPI003D7DC739